MNRTLPKSKPTDILASIKCTLDIEIKGLQEAVKNIGKDLEKVVDVLAKTKGRIIVTGMGKSGHVARKISATLASTGSPSIYVHPGEASHGDMGMITKDDVVIALSRNGGSAELADIIQYCKRFAIPVIGMTCVKDSALGNASDYLILLPDSEEACSIGMAPTTSTTQMMAMGDAIAVALFDLKKLTHEDYKVFHPGGKLGARLKRVSELMHKDKAMPLVKADTLMSEAILVFTGKNLGAVGILDNKGVLQGIITDGDLKRHMNKDFLKQKCSAIMTRNPKTIRGDALAEEALNIMNEYRITNLFVVENKKPIGIIHIHDILRAGIA